MLYDILPPLLFVFSLVGILVIVARAVARMSQTEVAASIKSVSSGAATLNPGKLLKPERKGVRAITQSDRVNQIKAGASGLGAKFVHFLTKIKPFLSAGLSKAAKLPSALLALRSKLPKPKIKRNSSSTTSLVGESEPSESPKFAHPPQAAPQPVPKADARPIKTRVVTTANIIQDKPRKKTRQPGPLQLAEAALISESYSDVEQHLVPYLSKHPKHTGAYYMLGQAALGQESWAEALEIFQQVINLDADYDQVYAQAGYAAFRSGSYSQAVPLLQRACDQNPQDLASLKFLYDIASRLDNRALRDAVATQIAELEGITSGEQVG